MGTLESGQDALTCRATRFSVDGHTCVRGPKWRLCHPCPSCDEQHVHTFVSVQTHLVYNIKKYPTNFQPFLSISTTLRMLAEIGRLVGVLNARFPVRSRRDG